MENENLENLDQENLEQDPEEAPEENEENLEDNSIDYTTYLQDIIDNQNDIISNQESLILLDQDIISELSKENNALKGITNIVVLTAIVVTGVWIVKNIFVKMM